jgi:hypothetical protein
MSLDGDSFRWKRAPRDVNAAASSPFSKYVFMHIMLVTPSPFNTLQGHQVCYSEFAAAIIRLTISLLVRRLVNSASGVFVCTCGNEFNVIIQQMKTGRVTTFSPPMYIISLGMYVISLFTLARAARKLIVDVGLVGL